MTRKRLIIVLVVAALVVAFIVAYPGIKARQDCEHRVQQAYANADDVAHQPLDLNAFCATWNNHPPGY